MQLTVHLEPAEEGGFTATLKEFPEVISEGDDQEQALANLIDALATYLAWKSTRELDGPPPQRNQTEHGHTADTAEHGDHGEKRHSGLDIGIPLSESHPPRDTGVITPVRPTAHQILIAVQLDLLCAVH